MRRRQIRRRRLVALAVMTVLLAALVAVAADLSSGRGRRRHTTIGAAKRSPGGQRQAAGASGRRPAAGTSRQGAAVGQAAAVDRVLRYTSYVKLAGHLRRDVALTFDDGPSPYTPQVLAVLRRMRAVATFFVIGREARAYPHFVADEARAGDEVGDHTEDHPPLDELSDSAQTAQITGAAQAIHQAGAPYPVLMRPPYGAFNHTTLQILREQRMLMVLWSADTSDYERPGRAKILYTGISGGQPGAIILMHDGGGDRSETVAALPRVITRLRQRGLRLVTVSQLLADDPPPRDQPPPTPLSGGV